MGPAGSGQLTKMINQICIAGLVQGLSEGIHFGKKAGLDIEAVLDVISKGAAGSWQMENRGKTMNQNKFDFGFAVDWMRKDLSICLAKRARTAPSSRSRPSWTSSTPRSRPWAATAGTRRASSRGWTAEAAGQPLERDRGRTAEPLGRPADRANLPLGHPRPKGGNHEARNHRSSRASLAALFAGIPTGPVHRPPRAVRPA
jgi:hypothetical protein